jgi:hypothetical protein
VRSRVQAVLNLDEVLRDVLAWDMYAVLASEASGGWGRAAQQAPLGFSGIEAYVEASSTFLLLLPADWSCCAMRAGPDGHNSQLTCCRHSSPC